MSGGTFVNGLTTLKSLSIRSSVAVLLDFIYLAFNT